MEGASQAQGPRLTLVAVTERPRIRPSRHLVPIATAIGAGLLLGALTSFAQGWLPDGLRSVSNSAGSWCLVAFVLAARTSRRLVAALVGSLTLLALLGGYVLASAARGFASSDALLLFWGLAAVLVGPVLGLAAHEVRRGSPTRAALGVATMSGVLVGEGAYGLRYIADTTYPPYWWGSIVVGIALLVVIAAVRLRGALPIAIAAAVTAIVAVAFVALYSGELFQLFG